MVLESFSGLLLGTAFMVVCGVCGCYRRDFMDGKGCAGCGT